jgi:hypothetical protein
MLVNNHSLPLIEDNSWGSFSALQQITIKMNDSEQKYTFNAQVEVVENEITIVGLTPVHSRSFLISYKNGIVSYEEHPFFRYPIKPEKLIADLQMVFVPFKLYKNRLTKLNITKDESGSRSFYAGKELLTSVTYFKNDKYELVHHGKRGYHLTVKNLDYEKL